MQCIHFETSEILSALTTGVTMAIHFSNLGEADLCYEFNLGAGGGGNEETLLLVYTNCLFLHTYTF